MMHGSLYLFSKHMGFHSTLPFGYTKNRVIPFAVRTCGICKPSDMTWLCTSTQQIKADSPHTGLRRC